MSSGSVRPIRILHYHTSIDLESGGVVRAVLDFCTGLAGAGHAVTLLTRNAKDAPEPWKRGEPGCPRVIEIDARLRPGGLLPGRALREIRALLAASDILHLHGMWTTANLQLAAAARRLRIPYVLSVHGTLDDWCMAQRHLKKRVYLAAFARRMLHGAAAVHCTAQAELDQSRKWFPRGRGVVVPLIFDVASFETLPGPDVARARFPELDAGRPCLLFLSRLHYKKGVELLLHAVDRLRHDGRECLAVIAGSGDEVYEQKLRRLAQELELGDRALFAGFVSGAEKISLYQAADLFVLPTSQENFGFVLFEALAAQTPVITTRGTDTWPEMEESGGAVVVDADPDAIAEAAKRLLDAPEQRRAMGEAGRAWVLTHLVNDTVVERFEQLYAVAAGAEGSPSNSSLESPPSSP